MTDLQKFLDLLESFGIVPVVTTTKDGTIVSVTEVYYIADGGVTSHYPGAGQCASNEKVTGYSSFYTDVEFGSGGTFIKWGAWE